MKTDFEREFNEMQSQGWRLMPFGELFRNSNEFMGVLEKQFNEAPFKKSYYKFIRKDISDKELQEDYGKKCIGYSSEMDERLRNLINDCDALFVAGKLSQKYFVRDIEQTNIVIQLKAIGKNFDLLKKYIAKHGNADPVNLKTETEALGKQILDDVKAIDYLPLQNAIVKSMISDKENMHLIIEEAVSGWSNEKYEDAGRGENYKRLKVYFDNYLKDKYQQDETIETKYTTKQKVLTYLLDCHANGVSIPIGDKKEIEKTGKRILAGKSGNTFYKNLYEIVNEDLNKKQSLIDIGGNDWRNAVLNLSENKEILEKYLKEKKL